MGMPSCLLARRIALFGVLSVAACMEDVGPGRVVVGDMVFGEDGNDRLFGTFMDGGPGNDRLTTDDGEQVAFGGEGRCRFPSPRSGQMAQSRSAAVPASTPRTMTT